jgi:hypothetical protein
MPDPWCSFGTRIASRIWGTLVYPRNCRLPNWRCRDIPVQTEVTNRWPGGCVACALLTLVGRAVKVGSAYRAFLGGPSTSPLGGTDELGDLSDVAQIIGAVGVIVSLI